MRPRSMFWGLAMAWGLMVAAHLVLGLGDLKLWIAFPLLFLPWILLGPSNWFDR